ncbi:hypothetical protein RJ639_007666 [Escallonia herrerae]|uniref:Uncharacterized protein n=1 Tax=Escallonia herrerae TaxID=1293975 RepID=A0AA88RV99_9ASTE|nr:hypothetical protein RJ639_025795 [Escallonia herrerae]KAK3017092.1 hypothetical protein RJ639_007666 [Escallonia herrerae]
MAVANPSLQPYPSTLQLLFAALDPKSLILSNLDNSLKQPSVSQLAAEGTDAFVMERGPRYKAYADLRESRLRRKNKVPQSPPEPEPEPNLTPPKKQVKFQGFLADRVKSRPSAVAQSVPDFSAVLRKENRKPSSALPPVAEKAATPPASSRSSKLYGSAAKLGGSKSANSGEKRNGGGLMARKSYASAEELKALGLAARTAINGENRGGRKTILGSRQY